MSFLDHLHAALEELHLLKHPFYQDWNAGKLSKDVLKDYAREYYHHVAAFPRYISAIHSRCDDIACRQVLLGNLVEEEQGENNHPELWSRFAEGLGATREEMKQPATEVETRELVDGYYDLVEDGYAKGLGALYAYERQTPAVSMSKIEGLKKFYDLTDERSLEFFVLHGEVDEWHSQECADLIEKLSPAEQEKAFDGAIAGAKMLWRFLDGMQRLQSQATVH